MDKKYWIIAAIIQIIVLLCCWPLAIITAVILFAIIPISRDIIERRKEK